MSRENLPQIQLISSKWRAQVMVLIVVLSALSLCKEVLCEPQESIAGISTDLEHDDHPDHPLPPRGAAIYPPDPLQPQKEAKPKSMKAIEDDGKSGQESIDEEGAKAIAAIDEELENLDEVTDDQSSNMDEEKCEDGCNGAQTYPKIVANKMKIEIPVNPPPLNTGLLSAIKDYHKYTMDNFLPFDSGY